MTGEPDQITIPVPAVWYTLQIPMPPTANQYYRHVGGRVLISAEGRHYRKVIAGLVAYRRASERRLPAGAGTVPAEPLAGRVAIVLDIFPSNLRRWDVDNRWKGLLDALTKAKVWNDDSQVDLQLGIRRKPDPRNERAEIHLWEL
jgi:Holliday junction resolvase RusA-like endonuclease